MRTIFIDCNDQFLRSTTRPAITRSPGWRTTLTAHAAFRTLEASMTLLRRAIDIVSRIVAPGQ
jgi:hypothetical protein